MTKTSSSSTASTAVASPPKPIKPQPPGTVICKCSECPEFRYVKPTPKNQPRTPKGWKNRGNDTYICGTCWKSCRRIRATEFMVGSIIEGGTWGEFLKACTTAWRQATAILNWSTATLWTMDTQREPGMEKMPPMEAVYLYGIANEKKKFQDVGASSRQSLFQLADARYRKKRYEIIWTQKASLSNFGDKQPFPVPSQNYKLLRGPDNEMRIQLTIGGVRWLIQLNGGVKMKGAKADFESLISGAAEGGQLDIIEKRVSASGRRKSGKTSDPETGQKDSTGVKLKISGWFPKTNITGASGTLVVRTDASAFLVATPNNGKRDAWELHGQNLVRSIARHREWLDKQSDDRKFEKRRPTRESNRYNKGTGQRCSNHKAVVDNWMHVSTRQVANMAIRLRMACVTFSKQETAMESFPWHVWTSMLAGKLDAAGIEFVALDDAKEKEGKEPTKKGLASDQERDTSDQES